MNDIEQSFRDGCDTIVAGCTTYGSTPATNSPTDIVTAIKNIYTNRYNSGYNSGKNTSNLSVLSYNRTPSGIANSGSGSPTKFNFTVNVGEIAILSGGAGDTTSAINFASGTSANTQGWSISDTAAILGSIRGGCNSTSSNDCCAEGFLIVKPTTVTGSVTISRTGGATAWVGISYVILTM